MTTSFDFFISPKPANLLIPEVQTFLTAVLDLHAFMPLTKVLLSQTQASPQDLNQFQVFTADARNWIDQLEFVGGDQTHPSLIRESTGSNFLYAEWQSIVALRLSALAAHNKLGQPSLMQVVLSSGSTAVVLNAEPPSIVHGAGVITINWHSPLVGHLDWIALYLVGAPNTSFLAFQYVPDGTPDGFFTFSTPVAPGIYEFRYLVANSYTSVATSDTVTVT